LGVRRSLVALTVAGAVPPLPLFLFLPPHPLFIKDLGMAGQTKRPTSVVLIRSEKDAEVEGLSELLDEVKALPKPH